jgi:hypothetical protein
MIKFDSSNNANYFIKYHNRMRNQEEDELLAASS